MPYVVGVDGGTESLRAHVFTLDGRSIGTAAAPYETRFPKPGRAEQTPGDWWRALGTAVRGAVSDAGIDAGDVAALGLDTTSCTVVALDADGHALRPAILWMDMRAAREAEDVLATGDPALALNGAGQGPVSSEWMIPKALWLKRHDPDVFNSAATICEYQDYMIRHLTGRRVASLDNVAMRWHYRTGHGGWPTTLLQALDLDVLADKWPEEIVAPGAPVGKLTAEAADHLGLPQSVVVAQGGADAFIGMIGLGVAKPGQLAMITGSSHLQLGVTDQPMSAPGLWGSYADAVYPGRHIIEGGQTSTGSIIAWYQRLTGDHVDLERLNAEAAALPPGAEGVMVLDHFQGNRTPHTDPLSRGAITGLSLSHGPAHIFRAIIEGICLGTRSILQTMDRAGFTASEIFVAGGATRSPLWLQIHADTAQIPVKVPAFAEAPALGSAILAAVGAGFYPDIDQAIDAMVRIDRTIEPDASKAAAYAELFDRYEQLYPLMKTLRDEPVASSTSKGDAAS
ncbi:FGGY-family carbohydrate kinase [Fodinicurvata sp. EGI_FJ10296]|uniref:FGGY-family carbohydrate kinase n=1 Tax=Fodinicurvata sp. EGI_FJ10296 TaxID=3231908 RepID=UPI0034540B88